MLLSTRSARARLLALASPALLVPLLAAQSICVEETVLSATGGSGAAFGRAVAVSGDLAVVSGDLEAYAFHWSGSGWDQEDVLTIPGAESGFGAAAALDGNTALIGLPAQDGAAADSGRALVFVRDGAGAWTLEAELTPTLETALDNFGASVALEGDRALIGAPGDDDVATNGGAVYSFVRVGTTWSEQTKIGAPGPGSVRFGSSVSLSGDTAAIGSALFLGGVFVFRESGGSWTEEAELAQALLLPAGVAVDADRLVVAGLFETLVFERSGAAWTETNRLPLTATTAALDGEVAVFGGASCPSTPAVTVWVHDAGTWTESADLALEGSSMPVAISGLRVVAGARGGLACPGGVASSFDLVLAPPPQVLYRNAGANPNSYAATPASIGETLFLTVFPNITGHTHGLVIGFDSPVNVTLSGGQTLLCLDLSGNGELVNTGFQPGPIAQFQLALPNDPTLAGFRIYTQGLHAFGTVPFALSNAQDITIGGCPH